MSFALAPAAYSLHWRPGARKDVLRAPRDHLERLLELVSCLVRDPRPPGASAKHGPLKGLLGLACGRFRILYRVDDAHQVVEIERVRDRKEAYR